MSELYREQCLFPRTDANAAVRRSTAFLGTVIPHALDSNVLHNLDLVMMRPGVSAEYDAARPTLPDSAPTGLPMSPSTRWSYSRIAS